MVKKRWSRKGSWGRHIKSMWSIEFWTPRLQSRWKRCKNRPLTNSSKACKFIYDNLWSSPLLLRWQASTDRQTMAPFDRHDGTFRHPPGPSNPWSLLTRASADSQYPNFILFYTVFCGQEDHPFPLGNEVVSTQPSRTHRTCFRNLFASTYN